MNEITAYENDAFKIIVAVHANGILDPLKHFIFFLIFNFISSKYSEWIHSLWHSSNERAVWNWLYVLVVVRSFSLPVLNIITNCFMPSKIDMCVCLQLIIYEMKINREAYFAFLNCFVLHYIVHTLFLHIYFCSLSLSCIEIFPIHFYFLSLPIRFSLPFKNVC
jgi:hypothetical protein